MSHLHTILSAVEGDSLSEAVAASLSRRDVRDEHAPRANDWPIARPAPALPGEDALSRLFTEHADAVCAYLYRRTGDRHVTEDLASDVFLAAMKGLNRWQERGIPQRHWMLVIASRAMKRWARQRRRELLRRLKWHAAHHHSTVEAQPALPGSAADLDHVRMALHLLSPREQTLLTLHNVEGLSVGQLAAAMGSPEGTMKSRLFRAREAFRAALSRVQGAPRS